MLAVSLAIVASLVTAGDAPVASGGWEQLRWGMTVAQAEEALGGARLDANPGGRDEEKGYAWTDHTVTVEGQPFTAELWFSSGKLYCVRLLRTFDADDAALGRLRAFDGCADALRARHGPEARKDETAYGRQLLWRLGEDGIRLQLAGTEIASASVMVSYYELATMRRLSEEAGRRPPPVQVLQRGAFSGALCAYQAARAKPIAAIERERRESKIGGVVDLRKLHTWQREVGMIDERIEEVQASMKELSLKPLPCADVTVKRLAACFDIYVYDGRLSYAWVRTGDCASADLRPYMDEVK